MADIARAMQTPPPASEQTRTPAGPDPRFQHPASPGAGEKAAVTRADNAARDAKNERARLRRKAKRAADLKFAKMAAEKKAAAPKRKKAKRKTLAEKIDAAYQTAGVRAPSRKRAVGKSPLLAAPYGKRRRGRPPGAKNKPKVGLAVALVPAPGVLPRIEAHGNALIAQINSAVALLNAMPEHARKVVLDAVK